MNPSRDNIRDDLEAQFELDFQVPPMTKNRAKDFTCSPGPGACEDCRRLRHIPFKQS